MPELQIATDKLCYLIVKTRAFEVLVAPEGNYDGSDAADDHFMAVLEDSEDNPVLEELESFLADLNEDEMTEVLTLLMIGRGDYAVADWDEAEATAGGMREERRSRRLLAIPLLPDYLENAMGELGLSCEEFEMGHL